MGSRKKGTDKVDVNFVGLRIAGTGKPAIIIAVAVSVVIVVGAIRYFMM